MTFRVTTSAHLATSSVTLGTPSASLSLAVLVETLRAMSASPTALGRIWRGHQAHKIVPYTEKNRRGVQLQTPAYNLSPNLIGREHAHP